MYTFGDFFSGGGGVAIGAREAGLKLMGDVPRIELFARMAVPGWDVWGNEVQSTVSGLL